MEETLISEYARQLMEAHGEHAQRGGRDVAARRSRPQSDAWAEQKLNGIICLGGFAKAETQKTGTYPLAPASILTGGRNYLPLSAPLSRSGDARKRERLTCYRRCSMGGCSSRRVKVPPAHAMMDCSRG
jgi:hypothetical protein